MFSPLFAARLPSVQEVMLRGTLPVFGGGEGVWPLTWGAVPLTFVTSLRALRCQRTLPKRWLLISTLVHSQAKVTHSKKQNQKKQALTK